MLIRGKMGPHFRGDANALSLLRRPIFLADFCRCHSKTHVFGGNINGFLIALTQTHYFLHLVWHTKVLLFQFYRSWNYCSWRFFAISCFRRSHWPQHPHSMPTNFGTIFGTFLEILENAASNPKTPLPFYFFFLLPNAQAREVGARPTPVSSTLKAII